MDCRVTRKQCTDHECPTHTNFKVTRITSTRQGVCGIRTKQGTTCQWLAPECPWHHRKPFKAERFTKETYVPPLRDSVPFEPPVQYHLKDPE